MSAMVENRPPQQQLDTLTDIKDAKTETGKLKIIIVGKIDYAIFDTKWLS